MTDQARDQDKGPELDGDQGISDVDGLGADELDKMIEAGLAEEGPHEGKVKVLECPDCGKSDLFYVAGMMTGHQYQCPHCGYQGALAVETWRTPQELRDQAGMD